MNEPGQARVVSLGFHQDPWARVVKQVDEEGMRGADLKGARLEGARLPADAPRPKRGRDRPGPER